MQSKRNAIPGTFNPNTFYVNVKDAANTQYVIDNAAALVRAGLLANGTDETSKLQGIIDGLPVGGIFDGNYKTFTVTSLMLKSDIELRNFNLITLAGTTDFIAPITIDGRPINTDLTSGMKRNIRLVNIRINGNRVNQNNITSPTENGGRHGFRLLGRFDNISFIRCSAVNCGTDGIMMYSATGRNKNNDVDYCFNNIYFEDCDFSGNRRHGISLDSASNITFSRVRANNNGLNLATITTYTDATNYTSGSRGDTVQDYDPYCVYGNGWDVEGYGLGSGLQNIIFDRCSGIGNARAGILFFDKVADHSVTGFKTRSDITITNGVFDGGVAVKHDGTMARDNSAISFTPPASQANAGNLYENIKIDSTRLNGILTLRASVASLTKSIIDVSVGSYAIFMQKSMLYFDPSNRYKGTKTNIYQADIGGLITQATLSDIPDLSTINSTIATHTTNIASNTTNITNNTTRLTSVEGRATSLETKTTAIGFPAAPTMSLPGNGQTGTLSLTTVTNISNTPYEANYRIVYGFVPAATGAYTQFLLTAPTGYVLVPQELGAVVDATGVPLQHGWGGGVNRFHIVPTVTTNISITVYVKITK